MITSIIMIMVKPDEVAVSILEFADSSVTRTRWSCRRALARSSYLSTIIMTTTMRRMATTMRRMTTMRRTVMNN